jgi:mannosyltransferase
MSSAAVDGEDQTAADRRRGLALMLAVTALGFALRAFRSGAIPLAEDEFTTYFFATEPLDRIFSAAYLAETNPPLYYLLQRLWLVFGDGESVMRLLPILFGTLCIPLVYTLGRKIAGVAVGCLAALLLATSSLHIEYSRLMRTYSLLSLATLTAALLLLHILRAYGLELGERDSPPPAGRRLGAWWAAYTFVNLVILYLHNTAVLFPALTSMLVLALIATRALPASFLKPWIAAHLALLLCAMPWLWVVHLQSKAIMPTFWIPRTTPKWIYSELLGLYPVPKLGKPVIFALLAAGCWIMAKDRRHRRPLAFLALFFAGQPLLLMLASLVQPVLIVRAMVWTTAFAFVPMAVALRALSPRTRWLSVAATVLVVMLQLRPARALYPSPPERDSVADFTEPLEGFRAGEDALVVAPVPIAWRLWYEARRLPLPRSGASMFGLSFDDRLPQLKDWLGVTIVGRNELPSLLSSRRVWFLREVRSKDPGAPPHAFDGVAAALAAWGRRAGFWSSGRFELTMLERTGG